MSASDRNSATPDALAFRELEQLVRHLVDELASFRRRALQAEARVRELQSRAAGKGGADHAAGGDGAEDAAALAAENAALRARLDTATERTRKMLERVRFLRQQHVIGGER